MQLFKFWGGKQLEYYVLCIFVVISYQLEMKCMSKKAKGTFGLYAVSIKINMFVGKFCQHSKINACL